MRPFLSRAITPVVAVVGVLAAGTETPARADLEILLSTNGTSWTQVADDPSGTAASYSSKNFGGFNVSVLSDDSNSPGTWPLSYLEGSSVHVSNNNATTSTLYIKLTDTGFDAPLNPSPITMDSQIGGSITTGGSANRLTFQSFVDPTDKEAMAAGFTTGVQTPSITGKTPQGHSQKSYSDDSTIMITSGLTSAYSITECFTITLNKGAQIGFQSSTNLSASTPEPSSLVLAVAGALGLIGYALRRRGAVEGPDARERCSDDPPISRSTGC